MHFHPAFFYKLPIISKSNCKTRIATYSTFIGGIAQSLSHSSVINMFASLRFCKVAMLKAPVISYKQAFQYNFSPFDIKNLHGFFLEKISMFKHPLEFVYFFWISQFGSRVLNYSGESRSCVWGSSQK